MAMGEARGNNFDQAQGWIKRLRDSIAAKPGDHSQALASLDELSANVNAQKQQAAEGIDVRITINSSLLPLVKGDDVLFVAIRDVKEALRSLPSACLLVLFSKVKPVLA